MRRKLATSGLSFAALILLTAGGTDDAILMDNFNERNDARWEHNDLTGVGIFDASSGAYLIKSSAPISVDDPSAGNIESHWKRSLSDPKFSNGTMRGVVRANRNGTSVGFLLRDNDQTESDYGFFGSTSFGTFYIERFEATQTIIAMADPEEFPFVAGQAYNLEASAVGDKITLKAWKVGDREPRRPMLHVTDKALGAGPGNRLSVVVFFDPVPLMAKGVSEVKVSGTFDNLTFTPADDD